MSRAATSAIARARPAKPTSIALTPYGIWNVDHGSPAIIGVRRPFIVGESLFPASQTGLELYGSYDIGALQVGYHLTLSNGHGPLDTYQDLNHDKAVGGRLFAKADTWAGTFTAGVSGYEGRYTDRAQSFAVDANGAFSLEYPITFDSRESSYGADVKWEWSSLLVQGEAIAQETIYEGYRPPAFVMSGPPGYAPNFRRFGVYGLAGYRFRFGGIMPFAGGEYYNPGPAALKSAAFWGGLNVRPTPRVVLKAQYTYLTPEAVARYWIDRRIRGKSAAPRAVEPAGVLQRVVARLPGAIGYVRLSELTGDVKVLRVDGRMPSDPGYPILAGSDGRRTQGLLQAMLARLTW